MEHAIAEMQDALSAWAAQRTADGVARAGAAVALLESAESMLRAGAGVPPPDWHAYLDATGGPTFLGALPDRERRDRWAHTTFAAIDRSGYSLRTLLRQRVARHGDRVLLEDSRDEDPAWTYAQVEWYTGALASLFLDAAPHEPRIAVYADNSVDAACADLACLLHGLLSTPLNVHFDVETLSWIFGRLAIDIVVTDTDARAARVVQAAAAAQRRVRVFHSGAHATARTVEGVEVTPLRQACARVDAGRVRTLESRVIDLHAPATVMFTSGSTGRPKGVVFSLYNLVTKRFARAAALPDVGRDEVLLCYLPLFHTFGRFLELLGMLYWGGTYVFAGSPSADALIAELSRVRPTGLISIPIRWTQIRQHCLDEMDRAGDGSEEIVRDVVGDRLRWGLSAAGYLDPVVFRFFQRRGIDLCSGFGMTEATGGVTMTPPGAYVDHSVGLPLPGIRTRFGDHGELHIAGPYVARYLDEGGAPGSLPDLRDGTDHWIATGDLFTRDAKGYLQIVDRVKDIYKNSRGQTVAPQRVEQRFEGVPGIRRTFVAGDHRDHNVLLIVPNREDPVLAASTEAEVREYFGQIVASVNATLAPYERVVRFAMLHRDFDAARDEITAKGSLRRKVIASHFADLIDQLYLSNHVEIATGALRVRIPRWFLRDLALLEDDIVAADGGVRNRRAGTFLRVTRTDAGGVRVGDLEYAITEEVVDLGTFARQPRLWLGNPALAAFAPCRPGWEVSLRGVSERVRLGADPSDAPASPRELPPEAEALRNVHDLCATALLGPEDAAGDAVEALGVQLASADVRVAAVVRRRLEALAFRREDGLRARAYRVLLLDEPVEGYDDVFPAFLESGLSFLDEDNIGVIARSRHGERRLQALRRRLHRYRTQLPWPGPPGRDAQFADVFRLLAGLARHDRDCFPAVEAELATWALFRDAPRLARIAARQLDDLSEQYERSLAASVPADAAPPTPDRVVFEFGIPATQRARLRDVLFDGTFLRRSLANAFGEEHFDWSRVTPEGCWVSTVLSHHPLHLYRLGINLVDGRHFDLLLVVGAAFRRSGVKDTVRWLTALAGHAYGRPALPPMGAWRRDLGAMSVAYVSDLTAWERIRELSRQQDVRDGIAKRWAWRKLLTRSMTAFFVAWDQSGLRIVPGAVTPANIAVPDADFHESTTILSIAGWRPYDGPLSLVTLLLRNFYRRTGAHYPQSRDVLQAAWIFDAALEALGETRGSEFLDELAHAVAEAVSPDIAALAAPLSAYRDALRERVHVPLPVRCAIERFREWERVNPSASAEAREDAVIQMLHLYRLDRFDERLRYVVYAHTYFAQAGEEVARAFDRLLSRADPGAHGRRVHLQALSTLQSLIVDAGDRDVFSRMVFPHARRAQKLELVQVGATGDRRVVVRSQIRDAAGNPYQVREPITPAELGHLYRLILDTDYPKHIAEHDRHLVVTDAEERIVGGLCYRWQDPTLVYVDGIVIADPLLNQRLGGGLLEDFCVRVAAQGARCVKTNFFLGQLFSKHGFQVNQRWGGLVRFLAAEGIDAAGESDEASPVDSYSRI